MRPDDPVDRDPALLLEGAHGTVELGVELERIAGGDVAAQPEVGEAGADLRHGRTALTTPQTGGHRTSPGSAVVGTVYR